jgi:hypothetical protein
MTSRQARRERREAERKAKKAEFKRTKAAATEIGFVSQEVHRSESPTQSRERSDRFRLDEAALLSEPKTQRGGFVSQNADPSTKRAEINGLNAQHSTGPRTANGKLASSRNSLKHGLASGELIISGEDRAAFEALLHDLIEDHRPANATEELLVTEMAQSWWLAQRALRMQNDCFGDTGVDEKRLSLFLRYQTTHERAFHKALNTLTRLKQSRVREEAVSDVGFVSQSGFASQTAHSSALPNQSPEQSDGFESGFVSPSSPGLLATNGFVSKNDAAAPQATTPSLAEAA